MSKTKRFTVTAAAFMLIISIPAHSADAPVSGPEEPAETEIILPRMYLEIEDLSIEEIDAVIPDDAAVVLSSLELPLPEPEQIEIPAEAFALSDADAPASLTASDNAASAGSSFFSEGTIGVGTSAQITGDINLYHIGEQPDFRLRYFHDSSDGFAGHEAGEGYSSREELIEAELNYSGDSISADLLVRYNELEDGLQGRADYFTLTRRIPEITGEASWQMSDLFNLTGSLDASLAGMQLNALTPLGFNLFSAAPEASIVFGTEKYNGGVFLNYAVGGQTNGADLMQQLGGGLTFSLEPADIFRVSGEAGILWDNFSSLYYPFKLEISGSAAVFEYELSGGYTADYDDRTDLWNIFPTAGGPESADSLGAVPLTTGWFADGSLRWNLSDRLSLNASAGFSMLENTLMPAVSGLNGFSTFTSVDSTCLDAGVGLYMKITNNLNISAGWEGQLLTGIDWFRPLHELHGELELTSADRDMGIIGDISFSVYDERQSWFTNDWLPAIGLEGYLRLSEGFVFSVSGSDLAGGLLDSGRNVWNGYLDQGAMLQAKIKISL